MTLESIKLYFFTIPCYPKINVFIVLKILFGIYLWYEPKPSDEKVSKPLIPLLTTAKIMKILGFSKMKNQLFAGFCFDKEVAEFIKPCFSKSEKRKDACHGLEK